MAEYFFKLEVQRGRLENKYGVEFRKIVPSFLNIHNLIWHIFSWMRGKLFFEYQAVKDGKVLSTAQVVTKLPIFPFMSKDSLHIGPCMTMKEERGKGFYPLLLQYIRDSLPSVDLYMMTSDDNIASQRGIAKVGGVKIGEGVKDHFGRYVITKPCKTTD